MLKMIAIGNLTGDPVLKTNEETGKPYAIMRIASDRRYKSPDGEKLTDFISIKVRGVLAERCAEFARKGCKIAASGDFETITFAEEDSLTLTYDAVVSALSQPVTNANILCVLFVVEWA